MLSCFFPLLSIRNYRGYNCKLIQYTLTIAVFVFYFHFWITLEVNIFGEALYAFSLVSWYTRRKLLYNHPMWYWFGGLLNWSKTINRVLIYVFTNDISLVTSDSYFHAVIYPCHCVYSHLKKYDAKMFSQDIAMFHFAKWIP